MNKPESKRLIDQAREIRLLSFDDCRKKVDLYESAYHELEGNYNQVYKELLKVLESINVLQVHLIELETAMNIRGKENE